MPLTEIKNTIKNSDLKEGTIVIWVYGKKNFHLKIKNKESIFDTSYFTTSDCDKNGMTKNKKAVKLIGVIFENKKTKETLILEHK